MLSAAVRRRVLPAPTPVEPGPGDRRGGRQHAAEVDVLLPRRFRPGCCSTRCYNGVDNLSDFPMRPQHEGHRHPREQVPPHGQDPQPRAHGRRAADEGGDGRRARARRSCSPRASPPVRRSRWRCTPSARAGTSAASRSRATTRPPSAAARRASTSSCASRTSLSDEQVERLRVDRRQVPGAPHARRRGHVRRACRARHARELSSRAGCAPSCSTPRRPRRSTSTAASTPPCSCRCSSTRRRAARRLHPPPRRPAPPRRRDLVPRRAPGRRRADLRATALREAHEEIGLPPDDVELIGALQPTPTIATNYAVYPFVGLIEPGHEWRPSRGRGRRGARAPAAPSCARATRAGACCAAACRSAPTSTWSATTSSGARRRGSSPTCSSGSPTTCRDRRRQLWPADRRDVRRDGVDLRGVSLPLNAGIGPPPLLT